MCIISHNYDLICIICEIIEFEAIKKNLGQKRPVLQSLQFHLVLKML